VVVVPEAPDGALDEVRVAKPRAVVIDEGKLVWRKNVGIGLGLDPGVDLGQLPLQMLGKALVDTGRGVLCNVNSLAKGIGAHAGYILCTHGGQ